LKPWQKTVLKLAITCLAFYLVFRKVSWVEFTALFRQLYFTWVAAAFLLYNFSQCLSAARLLFFYRSIDMPLTYAQCLSLYYRAMFYGLFLPGGVSGDAYKVVKLQNNYQRSYRELITATFSDRANGLVVLLSIGLMLIFYVNRKLSVFINGLPFIIILSLIAGWVLYIWLMYTFAKPFHRLIFKASVLSAVIQSVQLLAFFCILAALNISTTQWIYYGILFYGGSVLSALPISISGMGIREWVMVTGSGIFGLQQGYAFTASFTFFLVVSLSSLSGALFNFASQDKTVVKADKQAIEIL